MKTFIKQISYFFIILLLAGFTACGGGGGSSDAPAAAASGDQIEFDAALNTTDFPVAAKSSLSSFITGKSSSGLKVVAVPISGYMTCMTFGIDNFMVEAPVNANGSFKLNLKKKIKLTEGEFPDGSTEWDTDYVLLVVDSSGQVISFISMAHFGTAGAIGGSQTVVKLPISTANTAINLGTLIKESGTNDAKSNSSTGGNYSLNINQLRQIAQSDDIAKSVKNEYMNRDLETKVFYNWYDTAVKTATTFEALITAFSDPTKFNFTGCYIAFWEMEGITDKLGTFNTIKNNTIADSTKLGLYPPTGSTVTGTTLSGSKTYNPSDPITNDGTMSTTDGGTSYYDGDFSVTTSSTPIGSFDFAVGNPFVNNSIPTTSLLKTYVPAIKLTVTGTGAARIITGITIKWYLYNGTEYIEVSDSSIMIRDGFQVGISIRGIAGSGISSDNGLIKRLDDMPVEKTSYTSTDFTNDAGVPVDVLLSNVEAIRLSLNAGPFAYDYSWIKI